jgi:hypothetical protein
MSDLVYQNFNNRCQGWVNPSNLFFGPEIISLTGYQSPAGSNTVISIVGSNFFSYSIIRFGTFTPTVYFINSTLLSFYIPNTLFPGTYPVQVCNGSVCSNIVNYTIDMSSGYWMINVGGNTNTISNTNQNGVQISWLTRNGIIPVSNSGSTPGPFGTAITAFPITDTMNWISVDGGGNPDTFLQLPAGTIYIGRELTIKSISGNVKSKSVNIIPFSGSLAHQELITSHLSWVTIINKNGTLWEIMQTGS